ncbi:protein DpdF [Cupriavidus sp. 30B13]|uniref:protein DpdF n=1 Tax=Cupriavidus sp. 30B13 TaxID=3384241 RepID=UPI003B91E52A
MSFGFDELQAVLADWPVASGWPEKVGDSVLDRICQVLSAAQAHPRNTAWHADLQPLLRHVLLRTSDGAGKSMRLRVPAGQGWPDRVSWATHGVEAIEAGPAAYLLTASEWHPEWLGSGEHGVFADVFSDKKVRRMMQCEVDPFVRDATGFTNYSSPGQREAVRAAFLIPEGDTLLINLPTGSGKSLVGQAPALVNKEDGHLTIFVVPTVALALDQARAMRHLFRSNGPSRPDWPLAWYGGLSKEQRVEIRQRLRNGTQRILFTSPEALTTSLLRAVSDAAAAGMLRYFVIDEAHLVAQWGVEFRPSFQALAGLRHSLLRLAPRGFRTLLLSATFTEEAVETLASLFGPPERVQMVSAVHLRPEPQYWFYKAASPQEKQERVLEALRHAPRPFILYVTKRDEIVRWKKVLHSRGGLCRIATFDGGTPDSERLRILGDWAANRLDGIVATSAFGVGLDKSDVRTVVHATIPETLDRYYQEVGRGGRDGKSSVSLLVFDDSDWSLPERLAKPKIISDELGFSRWKAMYQSRHQSEEEGSWKINIDAVPEHLPGGSDLNVNWNMRTLSLMTRAGLITLDIEVNRDEQDTEPGEDASSMLAAMANVRVRIRNDGHLIPEVWEDAISASRNKTLEAAERNWQMMSQLLPQSSGLDQQIGQEVGATLAQLYRIRSTRWPVQVTEVCGGCPKDRFDTGNRRYYAEPVVVPVSRVLPSSAYPWREKFPWVDPAFAYVFYDESRPWADIRQSILQFAGWLVQSCGIRELAAHPASPLVRYPEWIRLYQQVRDRVLLHRSVLDSDLEPYSPLARLTVLEPDSSPELILDIQMLQRPFHLVLLPLGLPDPGNCLRRLADVSPNALHLENLTQAIIQ